LTYEVIVLCGAIGEDIVVEPISCEVQLDIGSGCSDWEQYINKEEEEIHKEEEDQQQQALAIVELEQEQEREQGSANRMVRK